MDTDSWLQIALFALLMLASAYFSSTETAFSTANTIRLRNLAQGGDKRAGKALSISGEFDRALSTILIGNNIVNLTAASIGTLFVSDVFGSQYAIWSTVVVTVVTLFVGESLPKSYARYHSEAVARRSAGLLRGLMTVFTPITFLIAKFSSLITRVFIKEDTPSITEEDLYDIFDTIEEEGSMEENKRELVQSALEFDELYAQNILTPRVDVVALNIDDSYEAIIDIIREEKYSRYPVYEKSIDNIIGVLQARRFLKRCLRGDQFTIRELLAKPYFVHKKMPIDDLLRDMRLKKMHMAIVSDDYGGTMGIVTMEDILEELVGEIWDEDDEVVEEFQKIGGGRSEVAGTLMVDDAFDRMGLDFDDDEQKYDTVGAWALAHFDNIPCEGDEFVDQGVRLRILTVNNNRITRVLMQPVEPEEAQEVEA